MTTAIESQQKYLEQQAAENTSMNIVVAGAFVRGIRDLGYKDNGKALAELVDNSWEAQANRVDIVYGYEGVKSKAKPAQIAVIDDGHGMLPEMIRHAMRWGGTNREGSITGFGRFGFGLPASCVSIGKSFTVYSKLEGQPIFMVSVDLDDIEQSTVNYEIGNPVEADIPEFIKVYLDGRSWESGTIVVVDKLDRLKFSTSKKLTHDLLLPHMGVTYHNVRQGFDIYVDGEFVQPTDPLFLTEGYSHYDTNGLTANSFDPLEINLKDKDTRQVVGKVKVRFSYLEPNFHFIEPTGDNIKSNIGPRWSIMEAYTGMIVSRMGRVLDVVNRLPKTRFNNYDKYIKVELDFDASLDSEFGVTTSKQQVSISERIWTLLENEGLYSTITNLRKEQERLRNKFNEQRESSPDGASTTSAEVMSKTKELMRPTSEKIQKRQKQEGEENLRKSAMRKATESNRPVEDVIKDMEFERQGRLFDVERNANPGGRFFSVRVEGGTKVLSLNTEHRFYKDLYMGPESTTRLRAGLDLLLFAIGDSMEDASDEARRFYMAEIPSWSDKLDVALDHLSQIQNPTDDAEQKAEELELEASLNDSK